MHESKVRYAPRRGSRPAGTPPAWARPGVVRVGRMLPDGGIEWTGDERERACAQPFPDETRKEDGYGGDGVFDEALRA